MTTPTPTGDGQREALLTVLREDVPPYVDTESAIWGAAKVLGLVNAGRPSAPTVTAERLRQAWHAVYAPGNPDPGVVPGWLVDLLRDLGIEVRDV